MRTIGKVSERFYIIVRLECTELVERKSDKSFMEIGFQQEIMETTIF